MHLRHYVIYDPIRSPNQTETQTETEAHSETQTKPKPKPNIATIRHAPSQRRHHRHAFVAWARMRELDGVMK
jgi:hypothetical protein